MPESQRHIAIRGTLEFAEHIMVHEREVCVVSGGGVRTHLLETLSGLAGKYRGHTVRILISVAATPDTTLAETEPEPCGCE